MVQFGMGQSVRRSEDRRLVTGHGRYTDDIRLPGEAHGYVVRSPHAHARIRSIDITAAAAAPGVLAVYTGQDLVADRIGTIPAHPVPNSDGSPAKIPPRPGLATDRVRHVGDQVAFVVAETYEAARDASELVEIDYEILPSITDTAAAIAAGQPLVWNDAPQNISVDWEMGDAASVDAAFAEAAHNVAIDLINNRIVVNSMEPRNIVASYEPETGYTVYSGTQGSHGIQHYMAEILREDLSRVRVVTPDVGGGFGMKGFFYPEQILAPWAAKRLGRPVRWNGERGESFLTDTHGRDHVTHAELALDDAGRFLALRVDTIANLGAYLSNYALYVPTLAGSGMLAGVYTTPSIYVRVRGVFTNTTPVDAYRGAGRPEAAYVVERLVDKAARAIGMAPEELRRRNFIRPDQMPYQTALGLTYDSGDFAKNMDDALAIIDQGGLPLRKQESARRGKLRGLGIATYIEQCGGGPSEMAQIRIEPDGGVILMIGTQSTGQGHETAYAQIIAEKLGVPFDRVRVVQGDTSLVASGQGTGGSRSIPVGGASTDLAAQKIVERGRKMAAHLLEAAEADIEFADGTFTIAGTDRTTGLAELAQAALDGTLPPDIAGPFQETANWAPENGVGTFPNGTHAVELEVDPETGVTEILRYVVVDDFGTVLNPLLLAGQVHGGVVQGVGQALYEGAVYDPESGQLVTGSFLDYTMPRADHIPVIEFSVNVIPCRTNRLGVKGAGEAGAIGAPPAVINAIVDALAPYGIEHVDMPATPRRIWEAVQAATLDQAA